MSALAAVVSAWAAVRTLRRQQLPKEDNRREGGTVMTIGGLRVESNTNLVPAEVTQQVSGSSSSRNWKLTVTSYSITKEELCLITSQTPALEPKTLRALMSVRLTASIPEKTKQRFWPQLYYSLTPMNASTAAHASRLVQC